jgi:hypothetical protein
VRRRTSASASPSILGGKAGHVPAFVEGDAGLGADRFHPLLDAQDLFAHPVEPVCTGSSGMQRADRMNVQSLAVMLCAVPPWMMPTCSVVHGGS